MTKMEFRRKRKAVGDEMEGEGNRVSIAGLDEESTSRSASSEDRLRGEEQSKRGEDPAHRWRAGRVEGGKGKGVALEMSTGEYSA